MQRARKPEQEPQLLLWGTVCVAALFSAGFAGVLTSTRLRSAGYPIDAVPIGIAAAVATFVAMAWLLLCVPRLRRLLASLFAL